MRPRAAVLALLTALVVAPGAAAAPRFAPYVDMTGYPSPNLGAMRSGGHLRAISLGFVVARGGSACAPAWGGYPNAPAAGRRPFLRGAIRAFRRGGAVAIPSFGGAAGAELATVCRSVRALAGAYRSVIRAYGASWVDFDVEGAAITNRTANDRRARAIALLQREARRAHRPLQVSYTLPVLPTGLDADGLAVLRNALRRHVAVDLVNVMAMDFGDQAAPDPDGRMGAYVIAAGRGTLGQLRRVLKLTVRAAARRLSVTPMIGINDVSAEVVTLDDARAIAAWARKARIGGLAMWSLARDRACSGPTTATSERCSGVDQAPWAFSRALG